MKNFFACVAAAVLFLGIGAARADQTSPECAEFIKKLAPEFRHGWVSVPENWEDPKSRDVRVFYYYRMAKEGKDETPVVFFNGGPASDSHGSYQILEKAPASAKHPFVYIDQRGTGCSDSYPSQPVDAENAKRLTRYGTRGIVKDSEAVRKHLFGAQKWKVFGQSYGGYIVHRYIEVAPEGVAAAYAHGASLMDDPVAWLTLRIQSQGRVLKDYLKLYPGDDELLKKARAQVPADYCVKDSISEACGADLLDSLTLFLGFRDDWPNLHEWIKAFLDDSGKLYTPNLDDITKYLVLGSYFTNGFGANIVSAVDQTNNVPFPPEDFSHCAEVRRRLMKAGEKPDDWAINECRFLAAVHVKVEELTIEASKTASDPQFASDTLKALVANPQIPFYLYSGEKDVFVPVETFSEETELLKGHIIYRNFQESGHEGFYTEPKVWEDLARSVDSPRAP